MKSLYTLVIFSFLASLIGCDIVTKAPPPPTTPLNGTDPIISEVFTLSPDKYYDYSWIEVYNPSKTMFNWYKVDKPAIGIVVGSDGTIRFTDNTGNTWQQYLHRLLRNLMP